MRIGILGPLEVRNHDGAPVSVAGVRLRTLLIALALSPGTLVHTARLVDAVWGDAPPAGASNALQALVSRLRRTLPAGAIESHPAGYRLAIDPNDVDVSRFERLVADGRAALPDDPYRAATTLREALSLSRGAPLLDVAAMDFFQPALTYLDELRLTAIEGRVEADLQLGGGAALVTELSTLVAEHPLRERLVEALMRALSKAGRPAEALTVYERTRRTLADRLGADPSPELSALHTALLRGQIDTTPTQPVDGPRRTNLPTPLTSFVGREADAAAVSELVDEYRLTTLVGPGGFGKTRLAIEVSWDLLDRMPDGAWLVELARVTNGTDVPAVVLAALDLREPSLVGREQAEDPADRLIAALRSRSTLLVLDNCEHVIDAAAALADRLLAECRQLRVLATSREALGITGEAVWPVDPLVLPPEEPDARIVLGYDAARLLRDRARAARPGFTVTDDNAAVVARICRVLDGMPLAIELAAARMRIMTVAQLAERLDDRFRLLTDGSRTALPRHQTLRAVVDWSWDLLSDAERVLLRRLAIFTGGATVDAAQQVCADPVVTADHVPDLVAALVEKSLLVVGDEVPRYRMLETIRAYGLDRLDEAGEREDLRRAHATYFVELVEAAEPHLRRAEQLDWLSRLKADHDNLNTALRGAIAAGDAQTAVRFVAAAGWYWWLSGHKAGAIELATKALDVPGAADDEARATAYSMVAWFATAGLGGVEQAEPWIRMAQELAKGIDHPGPCLRYVVEMGAVLQSEQTPGLSAQDLMQRLISDEDPWVRAVARLSRNRMLRAGEQEVDIQQALVEFRSIGERWGISFALATLAELAARRGDLVVALDYGEQAASVLSEIGAVEDLVFLEAGQAQLRWLVGDRAGSAAAMAQAERMAARVGWPDAVAATAYVKADLARWSGDTTTGRDELARVEAELGSTGIDPVFRAMILDSSAYLDVAEGDVDSAGARRAEALGIALGSKDDRLISQVLIGIADHAVRHGFAREAARLLGASEVIGGGPDLSRPDGARVAAAVAVALGEPTFAEAITEARKEFDGARRGGLATAEAVRELTASALST